MHKKRINGYDYFYMSVRRKGKITTIYLGQAPAKAKEAEDAVKARLKIGKAGRPHKSERNSRYLASASAGFVPAILRKPKEKEKGQARPLFISGLAIILLLGFLAGSALTAEVSGPNNTTLAIWDDTDVEAGFQVVTTGQNGTFYAHYYNSASGQPGNATGDYCEIAFNGNATWLNMTYSESSGLYEHIRSSPVSGVFVWNVSCHSSTLDSLNASDYAHVSVVEVTEFTDYYRMRVKNVQAYTDEF